MKRNFYDKAEVISEGVIKFAIYTLLFVVLAAILVAVEADGYYDNVDLFYYALR